jgi:hypothetical protein
VLVRPATDRGGVPLGAEFIKWVNCQIVLKRTVSTLYVESRHIAIWGTVPLALRNPPMSADVLSCTQQNAGTTTQHAPGDVDAESMPDGGRDRLDTLDSNKRALIENQVGDQGLILQASAAGRFGLRSNYGASLQ